MDVVFLALPNTGSVLADAESNRAKFSAKRQFIIRHPKAAAATLNYNSLWCDALNSRGCYGLTHFARMDSDIVIGVDYWGDAIIEEMKAVGADILAVVIPLKDNTGATSTGILLGDELAGTRRLTLKEVFQLPPTFSNLDVEAILGFKGHLAINTGVFVCRFTESWVERVCEKDGIVRGFTSTDHIYKDADDLWVAAIDTEDWKFARWCAEEGLKVFATRKIPVGHEGPMRFDNVRPWGKWETDEAIKGARKIRGLEEHLEKTRIEANQ